MGNLSDVIAGVQISMVALTALVMTAARILLIRSANSLARSLGEIIEAALIAVVLVFMVVQPFLMKTFYIPSPSMVPTLLEDDRIVCNKIAYRLGTPHREDIIVFAAPPRALAQTAEGYHQGEEAVDYIKRLIGLPGDIIEVRHGYITVNGDIKTHANLHQVFNVLDANGHQHVKIEQNDVAIFNGNWTKYGADQVAQQFGVPGAKVEFHPGETLRNGTVLNEPYTAEDPAYDMKIVDGNSVLSYPEGSQRLVDDQPPVSAAEAQKIAAAPPGPVPQGFVFAMGDNRNDSGDSTHWGPLEQDRLVGKASIIFWPIPRVRDLQ